MSNGQYPPPPPGSPPPKPGMPGWAKILIGCGCLALLIGAGVAAFTFYVGKKAYDTVSDPAKAAEWMISQDPNLEVVKTDSAAGTITYRNKTTGETTTINFADLKEGKLTVQDKDGNTVLDTSQMTDGSGNIKITGPDGQTMTIGGDGDLPSWVPVYPNVTETSQSGEAATGDTVMGVASQKTADSVDTVKTYYEGYLPGDGYTINSNVSAGGAVLISASKEGKTVNIAVGTSGGTTYVTINYQGPK
jgi:hypothetical protein